jgi:UDP-N-acetylglucosamine 2-epimerase (non-hydrolysing)
MKAAPVMREMARHPDTFEQLLVHTGQHYDVNMSQVFFEELDMIEPHINLEVGSGSHAWQTAHILLRFEPILLDYQPDWVVVYGDVNSTLACSLVSKKLERRVAHVEAGLRSFDRTMPEEINRLVTDQLADLLFTHSEGATDHLVNEGIAAGKIFFVGNVMIDTLVNLLPRAEDRWPQLKSLYPYGRYVLVTLHRPSNVDDRATLKEIMSALDEMSTEIPVLFPIHPRTLKRIEEFDLKPKHPDLILLEPLGYLDFLALQIHASVVLTDSGGIQEETTFLGIPCLTARPNTERPVTITQGTNQLVASNSEALLNALRTRLAAHDSPSRVPPLWDGNSAKRIVQVFKQVETNPE